MADSLMLVNVLEDAEARVAVVEDGKLQEFYFERPNDDNIVGNIYKGRVVNVKSNIEAAFVDFGYKRHGFLHGSDIKPSVARKAVGRGDDKRGIKSVKKAVKKGDSFLVQVTKEGIDDKGPALTTYLSLPGRHLVLMPEMNLRGVSKRIDDPEERSRIKKIIHNLKVPENAGVIARTAAEKRSERELQRDLKYLSRLWNTIKKRAEKAGDASLLYQESDQVIRVIRDVFNESIRHIHVDNEDVFRRVKDFLRDVMPHHVRKVKLYKEDEPIFHKYGVEEQLNQMHGRTVGLSSGGSIVLEQTEALVAIDVNSGQFKGKGSAEKTALEINKEAALEIARQIRLRDMGGLVIIDFIDMDNKDYRKELEKVLSDMLAKDKARFQVLPMSDFGIVQLTRQRRRKSLRQSTYTRCPDCKGTGQLKTPETLSLELFRDIKSGVQKKSVTAVEVTVPPTVADHLNNAMRSKIEETERESKKCIVIRVDPNLSPAETNVRYKKS